MYLSTSTIVELYNGSTDGGVAMHFAKFFSSSSLCRISDGNDVIGEDDEIHVMT
jgi:hypothetical protein